MTKKPPEKKGQAVQYVKSKVPPRLHSTDPRDMYVLPTALCNSNTIPSPAVRTCCAVLRAGLHVGHFYFAGTAMLRSPRVWACAAASCGVAASTSDKVERAPNVTHLFDGHRRSRLGGIYV